jgi:DNA-binding beta-propeller fold protein YncE
VRYSVSLHAKLLIGILFSVVTCPGITRAQTVDTVRVSPGQFPRFSSGRSIAVDLSGRVYVVDAVRNTIYLFDADGQAITSFGGSGTNEGQFDDPTDIDPTTGLLINVADGGNSRIQRFSRDFRFIENLPVSSQAGSGGDRSPSFRPGAGRVVMPADGYPVAVASSREDDLFVIEDISRRVLKWDRDRRNRWQIGQSLNRSENLVHPVDLAIAGDLLYVADQGRKAIVVFDLFGLYVRAVAEGRLNDIASVAVDNGTVFAILPAGIMVFNTEGRLERSVHVIIPGNERIVDAATGNGRVYLLTERHLYVLQAASLR